MMHLQKWSPPPIRAEIIQPLGSNGSYFNKNSDADMLFSTFKPLSVKLIMVDHVSHYIHDIIARYLEDTLHFTSLFPWITANT